MSSQYGTKLKVSIFGQSHSAAIGVVIDGLPAGLTIDLDELAVFLARRAPGQGSHTTARKEADTPEFLSGLVDGVTCGAPLAALIRNTDVRPGDYDALRDVPRPSHADYTAQVKYQGHQDASGGGHFSGRLTAPLCVAGGICVQLLKARGIVIGAHIARIGAATDRPFDLAQVSMADFQAITRNASAAADRAAEATVAAVAADANANESVTAGTGAGTAPTLPVLDPRAGAAMLAEIEAARRDNDSVGGVVECAAIGLPAGLGDPIFDGMENRIAQVMFGIPAVKGIEFGNGFAAAELRGSQNNDAFYFDDASTVKTRTNNSGGILGGVTSGMPLVLRVAFKPTPSIAREQESVNLATGKPATLTVKGRHDPCIVPRAVPCVEAALALVLADSLS